MNTRAIIRDPIAGVFAPGALVQTPTDKPTDRTLPELPPPVGKVKLTKTDQEILDQIAKNELEPQLAIRHLVTLAQQKKIAPEDAILRADPTRIADMFLPRFNDGTETQPAAEGTPVSAGCASGTAVFDVHEAEKRAEAGEQIILVVPAVEPEDVSVIGKVAGIVFATGGYGQHTAVLARDHGVPAINGSGIFEIDPHAKTADLDGHPIKEGDQLSIDGRLGEIYDGIRPVKVWAEEPTFKTLLTWAKQHQGIGVYANADSPDSIAKAFERGASGIGLCRTEHMFYMHFEERMPVLQSAILAWNAKTRAPFLEQLAEWQEADFTAMYRVAEGRPLTIRLIDPPRHELLPMLEQSNTTVRVNDLSEMLDVPVEKVRDAFKHVFDVYENTDVSRLLLRVEEEPESLQALSGHLGVSVGQIREFIRKLEEKNPMLGIRGVRLGVEVPELYDMQIRAILRAAATVKKEGIETVPRITIPMLGLGLSHDQRDPKELSLFRSRIDAIKREVQEEMGVELTYQLGAMIETPVAVFESHTLGPKVDYFSYGTNDLTSLMLGADRENQRLIDLYRKNEMLDEDPFRRLHPSLQKALSVSIFYGRHCGTRPHPELKAGVCGEQGADPQSVSAMRQAGMDYVSVSGAGMVGSLLASAQDKIRYERHLDANLSTVLPAAPPRSQIVGLSVTRGRG